MKKQRATITIIVFSLFFMLLGSQLTMADSNNGGIIFSKYIEELEKCQIVVLTDGKRVKNLSNSDTIDIEPSWSFDGKHIAFIIENGDPPNGPWYINIMDADGSNRRQVTKKTDNKELREFNPSFSPSGNKLIFTRSTNWKFFNTPNTPPTIFKIYTIDIDGSNERYLTDGYYAKWSPDGKKIALGKKGGIYIMDTDGKNQVKIADGYNPSWSLDGKYIAFSNYLALSDIEIFKMDSDGNNIVSLTKGMKGAMEPSWSPDGKYIIFSNETSDGVWSFCSIYKVSANGGDSVLISEDYSSGPSWFDPAFARKYAVDPSGKFTATWGWIKNR